MNKQNVNCLHLSLSFTHTNTFSLRFYSLSSFLVSCFMIMKMMMKFSLFIWNLTCSLSFWWRLFLDRNRGSLRYCHCCCCYTSDVFFLLFVVIIPIAHFRTHNCMLLRIIVGLVKEQNKSKKERKRTRGETQQMMKTANIESERERET